MASDREWAVRPLTAKWSGAAGALVKRVLEEDFSQALTLCADADLDDMVGTYKQPGRDAWVALADDHVVGVIAAAETPDGAIKIKRFYVDKAWRGRGIGRALHDSAEAWIERTGCQCVVLTTTEPMIRARAFYRNKGYEEIGTTATGSATLHHFRRKLVPHTSGARLPVAEFPAHGDGEIGVIIERPRGFLEGWHWDEPSGQLVLGEFYDRPVPVNYGFAPEWDNPADEDALDVIVMDDRRMRPGEALIGRPVGVLWRPDGDHKLLVEPRGGSVRPTRADEEYRERVSGWWGPDDQPTGWDGPDGVPRLMRQCRRKDA